jgi:hypothetical protein
MLAFGVEVWSASPVERSPLDMATELYPLTARYFAERPSESSVLWQKLRDRFAVNEFKVVFGQSFDEKMVLPAQQVLHESGLDMASFSKIWHDGRLPLPCTDLTRRYGPATCRLLVGAPGRSLAKRHLGHTRLHSAVAQCLQLRPPEHTWFGCALPLGIQRIGPGLMAFALRHERIAGGQPVVILNGHFSGLASLFDDRTPVVEIGLPSWASLDDLRRWVIGSAARPELCQAGSIRRDALKGRFPVDDARPLDPQANAVHCSDGLVAGLRERVALLGRSPTGALADRLVAGGLTADEISEVVLADPLVGPPDRLRHLTDLTRGQDVEQCAATVLRYVPAVFGEPNGRASGVRLSTFTRTVRGFVDSGGDVRRFPDVAERRRRPVGPVAQVAELDDGHEDLGRAALRAGAVGLLVPAGGTGGRFGGYGLAEDDPRRHKPLAPVLHVGGSPTCALDIRLANACSWRAELQGSLRVAVMASATNAAAIDAWRDRWVERGVDGLETYTQRGVYRLTLAGVAELVAHGRIERWADHVLRDAGGRPSLKPFGALGCLTAFALDGRYERWREAGVETLVIGNADDAAFRLDPRVLGHLDREGLDAVVLGVPQGFRARVPLSTGHDLELRGDASGWCVDHRGRTCFLEPLEDGRARVICEGTVLGTTTPSIDVGGVLGEVERAGGWGLAVVEGLDPAAALEIGSLFSANQLYLRCRALDPFLARGHEGVADLIDALPTFAEHKIVGDTTAVQFVQPVAGVLRVLDPNRVGALAMQRAPVAGQRGGYGAMKERADVPFTQHMLDTLAARPDDLLFPGTTSR